MDKVTHTPIAALAVLLIVLVFGGCGSGSPDPKVSETVKASKQGRPVEVAKPTAEQAKRSKRGAKQQGDQKNAHRPHQGTSNRENGESKPSRREPDEVARQLKKLMNDGDDGKRVVSSPKQVREVLRELDDRARDGNSHSDPESNVDSTLEKVLGDR